MHTPTQHATHTNWDRFLATKRNNTSVLFGYTPVGLGLQILQQPTTTPFKLYRTFYESLLAAHKLHQQTIHTTKHKYSHYEITTCEVHNLQPQPVQILITHVTTCWHTTNSKHQDCSTSTIHWTPHCIEFTHPLSLRQHSHPKTRLKHDIRQYSIPRNTPLRTHTTTWKQSAPQQTSLRPSPSLAVRGNRIHDSIYEVCIHCNITTHRRTHIMTHCPALTHIGTQHKQPTRPVAFSS